MTIHSIRYPGEDEAYRRARDELLEAEMALRAKIEEVAAIRRGLPPGGLAQDYRFEGAQGPVNLSELFEDGKDTLILYSYMFGPGATSPCPMCSAFLDSADGQIAHVTERVNFAVVARNTIDAFQNIAGQRGWRNLQLLSAANNTYASDYHSEMPDGNQVPMCTVFTRRDGQIRHFWSSEMFFAPSDWHPRHIDMLWPLWHYFDLTPEGRESWMPALDYTG
ncbi:MAG: DUF899 family protein [Proteobacteria bacterium]|nr:DUF899 family protein [Pseudomonadota bacterium]